ncbi:zinc-ribbon domain-containing protein [Clostridium guangxiense]|uniref:zinc-ribbon domain-containing protein n=1 Tax=Clostridium guangxiense TaxID=1662055 RepID=UPI001E3B4630|nr:zinc-ribbon domain-containing protein [Clostridium guangxiense]MCD2346858.1 zinc-ribbon domain-containing protein [Clostridium guangxiense]
MSKVKVCKSCSKEIAKSAKFCPYCGAKLKMGILKKVFLSIATIFVLLFIIGLLTPDDSKTTNTSKTNKSSTTTSNASKQKTTANNTKNKQKKVVSKTSASNVNSNNSPWFVFNKEKEELSDSTIQSLYNKKMNYVNLKNKLFSPNYYKLTMDQSNYIYYGDLKDNKPNGKGILLEKVTSIGYLYVPLYIGYFKDGNFNGFGYEYKQACENNIVNNIFSDFTDEFKHIGAVYKSYEGYFKDGKFDGNGNSLQIDFGSDLSNLSPKTLENTTSNTTFNKYLTDNKAEIDKLESDVQHRTSDSQFLISKLAPLNSLIDYSGSFSKDKLNGKGKGFGRNNAIIYDGNFSKDEYDGTGKLYYNDGKLKYNGNFSKGKYNGKGTLYNEDGSIKYSGEWSDGDIK